MKKWLLAVAAAIWMLGLLATLTAGEGKILTLYRKGTFTLTVTDTACDSLVGTVTSGDSGAYFAVMAGAGFKAFEWGDSVKFDTAAILDTGRLSPSTDNDSNSTTIKVLIPRTGTTALLTVSHMGWGGGATIRFDSSGQTSMTRTVTTIDNDSQVTVTVATAERVKGWKFTLSLLHASIHADADSLGTANSADTTLQGDSLYFKAKLSHVVTGWHFRVQRGGEITTKADTSDWVPILPALAYRFLMWCPLFSRTDSTIVTILIQTRISNHDSARVMNVASLTLTNTNLDTAVGSWVNFGQQADGDSTKAKGGMFGPQFRTIVTAVDSNSLPAAYGRIDQYDVVTMVKLLY